MAIPDSSPTPARVAVITVSFGSDDVIPDFLGSIPKATSESVDVVVVDNRPVPGSIVESLARTSSAVYLPLPSNPGYGQAINRAVSSLPNRIEWLLVSNPDVVLQPGAIDGLLKVGLSADDIGSVGPRILTEEGGTYPSARSVPSIRVGIGHAIFARFWPSNPWSRRYRNEGVDQESQRDTGWLSGACVLVRRSVFSSIDGFDAAFFMYFEDVDLGARIGDAGYRNVYAPSIHVTHTGAHSTQSEDVSAKMIESHHRSAKTFVTHRYPGAKWAITRWVLISGLTIRSVVEKRAFSRSSSSSTKSMHSV